MAHGVRDRELVQDLVTERVDPRVGFCRYCGCRCASDVCNAHSEVAEQDDRYRDGTLDEGELA